MKKILYKTVVLKRPVGRGAAGSVPQSGFLSPDCVGRNCLAGGCVRAAMGPLGPLAGAGAAVGRPQSSVENKNLWKSNFSTKHKHLT